MPESKHRLTMKGKACYRSTQALAGNSVHLLVGIFTALEIRHLLEGVRQLLQFTVLCV